MHQRTMHPGLPMGFHTGKRIIPAVEEAEASPPVAALPKISCRLCGYETESCWSFTTHLGIHAESGGGSGARSATDVVCGICGMGFAGRTDVGLVQRIVIASYLVSNTFDAISQLLSRKYDHGYVCGVT